MLRQKHVHLKDKTPRLKESNVIYAVQCSQDYTDLYIRETNKPLHKWMAQHRRAKPSGQDSAVHLHLRGKNNSFEDNNVNILSREDRCCERGIKESIYVELEQPSLNRGGGLLINHTFSRNWGQVHMYQNNLFPPVFLGIVSRIFVSKRIHWKRLGTL